MARNCVIFCVNNYSHNLWQQHTCKLLCQSQNWPGYKGEVNLRIFLEYNRQVIVTSFVIFAMAMLFLDVYLFFIYSNNGPRKIELNVLELFQTIRPVPVHFSCSDFYRPQTKFGARYCFHKHLSFLLSTRGGLDPRRGSESRGVCIWGVSARGVYTIPCEQNLRQV